MSRSGAKTGVTEAKKVSTDLFVLTYGATVAQLIKDYENPEEVNKQLDQMGYNIGLRLIDDFLAKTNTPRCHELKDVADKIQTAFRMYLGFAPTVTNWSAGGDEFSLLIDSNPLTEYVELPDHMSSLRYCNLFCGAIRGALEQVHIEAQATIVQDSLRGDNTTEIRVKFVKKIKDAVVHD